MTARITGPEYEGEPVIKRETKDGFEIIQRPDDPLALRISIGSPIVSQFGAYIVYRGDEVKVIELLRKALTALGG